MATDNFSARLAQAKLATKVDIADFVKKASFDETHINVNKKGTLNKTRHVEVKNEVDDLSKKVKIISTKRLTKLLINKYK